MKAKLPGAGYSAAGIERSGVYRQRCPRRHQKRSQTPFYRLQMEQVSCSLYEERTLVKKQDRKGLIRALKFIWDSENIDEAREKARKVIMFYEDKLPEIASKLEEDIEETLAVLTLPVSHRKRMKSTNMLERLSGSIAQRTNVARVFPGNSSCLRLITAVLKEIHEDWIGGRKYLRMEESEPAEQQGDIIDFEKDFEIALV